MGQALFQSLQQWELGPDLTLASLIIHHEPPFHLGALSLPPPSTHPAPLLSPQPLPPLLKHFRIVFAHKVAVTLPFSRFCLKRGGVDAIHAQTLNNPV